MRTIVLFFALAGSLFSQIGAWHVRGTVRSVLITNNVPWPEIPSVVVYAQSTDPEVASFEVTVNYQIDNYPFAKTATVPAAGDKATLAMARFFIPLNAQIVSYSIVEKRDPYVFTVNQFISQGPVD